MLTRCDFVNSDGITGYSLNTDVAPLTTFDPSIVQRVDTTRNKPQQHGTLATKNLRSGLEIHCEGDLFGDDADLYWAQRKLMIAAFYGDPNVDPDLAVTRNGTLYVGFSGETEDYKTDVVITLFTAPIIALNWARTAYAVTFFSWTPWCIGVDTATRYYIA
jgi:hypothetical protein